MPSVRTFLSSRRRTKLRVEELEKRLTPSAQPTALEQLLLERLNDIREDPSAYGQTIGLDLSYVSPSQALAFDTRLIEAARGHSQDMNDNRFFGHVSSNGDSLGTRLSDAGFPWTSYGESIAAGFATPEAALKALIIDNGIPSLGHRRHLLAIDAVFKNQNRIGVGIVEGGSGPYVNYFTVDTSSTSNSPPNLTGTVFNDANENGKYDLNEGVGNLTLEVHGVGTTTTFASGGYGFQLSPGTYTVTFSGGQLVGPITKNITVGSQNFRLNILTDRETGDAGQGGEEDQPNDGGGTEMTLAERMSQLRRDYGFQKAASYYQNTYRANEKWFKDRHGDWFAITPNGDLYEWQGATFELGDKIERLDATIYEDPRLLFNADVNFSAEELEEFAGLQRDYRFHAGAGFYENWIGHGEKWFKDRNNEWYFITADGNLYQWGGKGDFSNHSLVATVEPVLFDDPSLLFEADAEKIATTAEFYQWWNTNGFHFAATYYRNWGGLNEFWLLDAADQWYFALYDQAGDLKVYHWAGENDISTSRLIATVDAAAI